MTLPLCFRGEFSSAGGGRLPEGTLSGGEQWDHHSHRIHKPRPDPHRSSQLRNASAFTSCQRDWKPDKDWSSRRWDPIFIIKRYWDTKVYGGLCHTGRLCHFYMFILILWWSCHMWRSSLFTSIMGRNSALRKRSDVCANDIVYKCVRMIYLICSWDFYTETSLWMLKDSPGCTTLTKNVHFKYSTHELVYIWSSCRWWELTGF